MFRWLSRCTPLCVLHGLLHMFSRVPCLNTCCRCLSRHPALHSHFLPYERFQCCLGCALRACSYTSPYMYASLSFSMFPSLCLSPSLCTCMSTLWTRFCVSSHRLQQLSSCIVVRRLLRGKFSQLVSFYLVAQGHALRKVQYTCIRPCMLHLI